MGFGSNDMIKMITDYGVSIIIVGIFLYASIRLINLGIDSIKEKMQRNKHDESLDIRDRVGKKIQYLINVFLENHSGHRIHVVEFSNSVMSIAYLPFRYMTCTYEVNTLDLSGSAKKIDKLSTSLFNQFFDNLQNEEYCIFDINNHDKLVGGAMYDLMKDIGEHKCICTMLKTAKGTAIGYIAFYKDDPFTESDKSDIVELGSSIEALLCVIENKDTSILDI